MSIIATVKQTNYESRLDPETGTVAETTIEREGEFELRGQYLYLDGGPMSMPVSSIPDAIERGGWCADAGTKPVFLEPCSGVAEGRTWPCGPDCGCGSTEDAHGGWGGRNYPRVFVEAQTLATVLEALVPA